MRRLFHHQPKIAPPSALEQRLTEILATLPVPIRIIRYTPPDGGLWYQWKAMLTGTGDCGRFEDAVEQALTYVLQKLRAQAPDDHPPAQ